MRDSVPLMIPMTYDMACETFHFAWRNERFVFARFSASSRPEAKRPGPLDRPGGRGEKVAQKRSQGLGIVNARNFVRVAASGRWRPLQRGWDGSVRWKDALGVADRATIDARIAAHGGHFQSAKVICPPPRMAFALIGVGKSGMSHAHKCAAVPIDEIDLDQA
jgi:hypothetical protein